MTSQPSTLNPQLPLFAVAADDPRIGRLEAVLRQWGWQTRAELMAKLAWTERDIRAVAEAAGPRRIVRGQKGFNTAGNASAEECAAAAGQALAQGRKMLREGLVLRRIAHLKLGNIEHPTSNTEVRIVELVWDI
jgi:hypothetical protein